MGTLQDPPWGCSRGVRDDGWLTSKAIYQQLMTKARSEGAPAIFVIHHSTRGYSTSPFSSRWAGQDTDQAQPSALQNLCLDLDGQSLHAHCSCYFNCGCLFFLVLSDISPHANVTLFCLSIWMCSFCWCSCCRWWRFISVCVAWALMLMLPCSPWASESAAAVAVDGVLSRSEWFQSSSSCNLVLPEHPNLLQLLQLLQLMAFYLCLCVLSPHAHVTMLCLSISICSSCCSCCNWWRFISVCVAWVLMLMLPCSAWASESASAAAAVAVDGVFSPSAWLEPSW